MSKASDALAVVAAAGPRTEVRVPPDELAAIIESAKADERKAIADHLDGMTIGSGTNWPYHIDRIRDGTYGRRA